ncbi:MAG: protein kinase [Kofleriaceae bacterium]|nr:protein kinase [Kofleriaceae bacterium]
MAGEITDAAGALSLIDVACPAALPGLVVEAGPDRVRHELVWRVRLGDGRAAVVAQLVPELAAEAALRRRWVHDVERLAGAGAPSLAVTVAVGPEPDPRDPAAEPPWRVRVEPPGRRLDAWLGADGARRPIDEIVEVGAALADAVAAAHAAGVVLRDLEPRAAVLGDDGRVTFTDVGLARLGILSSRTASTLALEASPWAAPEHLRSTVVDARADIYSIGAILHRALLGLPPATTGIGPLRQAIAVPPLVALRADVPGPLDELVRRCLAPSPDERPASAREVADALRGRGTTAMVLARVTCQACGQPLRAGMRLCLSCGKQAVQVGHTAPEAGGHFALVLSQATEKPEHLAALRELYQTFGEAVPSLNFLVGDERLYSKEERKTLHRVPARLFEDIDEAGARQLAARLTQAGLKARVLDVVQWRRNRRLGGWAVPVGLVAAFVGAVGLAGGSFGAALGIPLIVGGGLGALFGGIYRGVLGRLRRAALGRLRATPAALPAADPLVARLADLLGEVRAADVRERVAEMALWLQRIADHRAEVATRAAAAVDAAEIAAVLEPVGRLVDAIAAQVRALIALDGELAALDEGALVRALAASEARGEPAARRAELLGGLDRLRGLEDRRAALLGGLLEAGSVLRRASEVILAKGDQGAADQVAVAQALALLDAER